jgi:hypothetical protein
MSTVKTTFDTPGVGSEAAVRDRTRELLGQVMGFVAVTVGFAALGAYLGRDLSGATGILLFIAAFACIFALNSAATRCREQLEASSSGHSASRCHRTRPCMRVRSATRSLRWSDSKRISIACSSR